MKYTYTEEQQTAIRHRHGNLQILACAGSGKTEVISRRIADLVAEGVPKGSLVAFTFTDRAAEELKGRIRTHLEESCPTDPALGDMYVGTIHSFCLQILKDMDSGWRRYEVLDESRQAALIMSNYHHFPASGAGIGLNYLSHRTRSKRYWEAIRTFIATVSVVHQRGIHLDQITDHPLKESIERYQEIAYGRPNFFFDFDQIIGKLIAELKQRPDFLKRLRDRLQYLVVDEYQDIDDRQEELIGLLSNHGQDVSVTVVGDDDQAIYGWRGARIQNILSFDQRYADVKQVKLTYNFRSTHAIAEIADAAVRRIGPTNRLEKEMEARHWDQTAGAFVETMAEPKDVRVRTLPTEEAEATWVADRILELRGVVLKEGEDQTRAIDFADMAILLRSVKSSGKILADTLQERGIPVVVKGVGGLFDHAEVLLVQATFSLLARSYMLVSDSGAPRRLGEVEIREFIRKQIRHLRSVGTMPEARETTYLEWIAAKREELSRRLLERDRRGRLARRIYPQSIFQEMLKQLGSGERQSPWPNEVLFNLGRLSGLITDFETVHQWVRPSDLQALCLFLGGWAANQVDEGGLDEGATPNAVQIMTVHAAKGLEWPVVFLPRISSANFPSSLRRRGPSTFLSVDLFDPTQYASGDEGERRLWYVALTRCRRFLNVSTPDRKNKRPTLYFKEISHDIVARDDEPRDLPKGCPTPPASTELLPTTYTELNYYWRCPFEYQLRALMGFEPGVRESYGYGQQIHNILAEIHQRARTGLHLSAGEVSRLVEQRFHLRYTRDGEAYKPLSQLREAARLSIARYLESYPESTRFVLDAEKPFEFVDRDTGALISGTVDLIQRVDHDGCGAGQRIPVAIVDFKAHRWESAHTFTLRRQEVEAQLRLYAIAVGNTWPVDTEAAYAHFLSPNPPSQGLLEEGVSERVSVDVSREARESVRDRVGRAVQEIQGAVRSGEFALRGVSNGSCRKCDFREICPGYERWKEVDKTTPRPPSVDDERVREMVMVEEELSAG